jgi:hypothetical protein
MINIKYVAPDGKEFKWRTAAIRYMNDNNLPGMPTVIKMKEPKTKPKKQEIYFLPIVGLRLIETFLKEIPITMLSPSLNEYYGEVKRYHRNMLDISKGFKTNHASHESSYWQFLMWILRRMPEDYDDPKNYYMRVYDDFLRDLKIDMRTNNELYGHREGCTEYDNNFNFIENYLIGHIPKEGYNGQEGAYINPYHDPDKKEKDEEHFNNPLYYHDRYGWGLALTLNEFQDQIKFPLNQLSKRQFAVGYEEVQRGHQAIDVSTYLIPNRLKPLGFNVTQSLRPLLATQGIFCPCRCNYIHHKRGIKSTIQHLLSERLLFKITDDGLGSLKLINWPYNDPPI